MEIKLPYLEGFNILTQGLDIREYKKNAHNKYRNHVSKQVVIEDGVWLAANVIVCPGSYIAKNIVVAAGSVVSGKCEVENSLYGGVPAKFLKEL